MKTETERQFLLLFKRVVSSLEKISSSLDSQSIDIDDFLEKLSKNQEKRWLEHVKLYHPEEYQKLIQQQEVKN